MKLNQVIALVNGRKARATKTLTEAYRWEPDKLKGLAKTYKPLDEEGDKLPAESRTVPVHADEVINKVIDRLNDYYDSVATQEQANQTAKADVKIGEAIILKDVPVTVLLFFEKQLIDLLTFSKSIPVLPVDKEWTFDEKKGCYKTEPEETTRTQKLPKPVTLAEPTKEHPAQVQLLYEDKIVGTWSTVHMSGAIPQTHKTEIINRIEKLQDAVKKAREEANGIDIGKDMSDLGSTLVDYVFTGGTIVH